MIPHGKTYHIPLNVTWRCSNACPYCWTILLGRNRKNPAFTTEELPYSRWLEIFSELPKSVVDISGGEPLLYDKLSRLIKGFVEDGHVVALSTSLAGDVEYDLFLALMDPHHLKSMTCSYHKYSTLTRSKFLRRVVELKGRGFPVKVNVVQSHHYYLEFPHGDWQFVAFLRMRGIPVYVSPFEDPHNITRMETRLKCNAGSNTFWFNPNGDVYRCITWFRYSAQQGRHHLGYLGNVAVGSFTPLRRNTVNPCNLRCDTYYITDKEHHKKEMFSNRVEEITPSDNPWHREINERWMM